MSVTSPSNPSRRSISAAANPAAPPPTITIRSSFALAGRLDLVAHEHRVVALFHAPARHRVEGGRGDCLAGAQTEAGMVPRTSYRVANHQALGEGPAIMRAGRADREDFIAAAREQHGVLAHVSADHAAIGKIIEGDAAREIGSFRFGLLGGHNVLPIAGSTGSFGWRRTRRHAPIG